jgi:hypothetical protein
VSNAEGKHKHENEQTALRNDAETREYQTTTHGSYMGWIQLDIEQGALSIHEWQAKLTSTLAEARGMVMAEMGH